MKRFLIKVDTGFAGATHEDEVEFEEDTWEAMSQEEREKELGSCVQELIENNIEGYWEEL